jgi:hypothetical protein
MIYVYCNELELIWNNAMISQLKDPLRHFSLENEENHDDSPRIVVFIPKFKGPPI